MNRIWKYNILIAVMGLLVASCSQEEGLIEKPTDTGAYNDAYIRVMSGQVGYSTRGLTDEPEVNGQCNADRLIVYQYRRNHTGAVGATSADPSKMEFDKMYETEVEHFSDQVNHPYFQSDKWARQMATLRMSGSNVTSFAFPSLAYTDTDKDNFEVSYTGNLDKMSLKLIGSYTPEVYFGRVDADGLTKEKATGALKDYDEKSGIYREYIAATENWDKYLTGKLYRIVSQINIKISNVNPDIVERMTMELSNIPTEIGLYADHRTSLGSKGTDQGYHYPIVAAKSTQQTTEPVVVSETNDFRKGEAKLSTFLLPSDEGRSLKIHVYFKEDMHDGFDEEGNPIIYREKSYEVRPPKSYYIPADIAQAYFFSEPLCVYNVTDNLFYSFSNVRININGDFDNFFPDRIDVDMNIEVCSRYDNEHNYGDIDYK